MTGYIVPHFGLKRQFENLRDELLDATEDALSEGILMDGVYTSAFEDWLKNRTTTKHAIVTHSGTQALELMAAYYLSECTLADDDEAPHIRIPNLTYPATLNAFISTGWEVELVDTDKNGLMDTHDMEHRFNHYDCFVGYCGAASPKELYSGVFVDGAQHWLTVDQNTVGDAMAISFDPTKNLSASGNGGAIVTNDAGLYEFATSYKNNGKPDHFFAGTNSRMSELDCAHLLVKTKYIDEWQSRRKKIRKYYLEQFEDLPIRCLSRGFEIHADQKFVIYTESRNELLEHLKNVGIEAKIHYPYALSELPIARDILIKPDPISTSVALTRGVLSLPMYPELTDSEVEYIVEEVKNFYENAH